ncbi:MAG TPA: DNA topoisomerase IB [Thermoanaerobaculia bacterium]
MDRRGRAVPAADRERIRSLVIPPAWTGVRVAPSPRAAIQAIGQDAAGRWQYLYSAAHARRREREKFRRMQRFGAALPRLRAAVTGHLRRPDLDREKVMACILRILSTCFFRPGSQEYASDDGGIGIATLRPEHVTIRSGVVIFDFPGKSGKRQRRVVRDRTVAAIVSGLKRHPAPELFQYRNGTGEFVDVKRRHINRYIKEVMGEAFSAKDFRTWAGTLVCALELGAIGAAPEATGAERRRHVREAVRRTAAALGNTPAVCRSSYIHSAVIREFERGRVIRVRLRRREPSARSRAAELALLRLLRDSEAPS